MNIEFGRFSKVFTIRNSIIGGIILVVFLGISALNWFHTKTVIAEITGLERHDTRRDAVQFNKKKSTRYKNLVYTDKGTFKDSSDLLRGKFGSKFFYNLNEGKTYELTVSGYDLGVIGLHPNIIKVKEVEDNDSQ